MNIKTAYVETTNLCNLNCATCYNRSGLNKHRSELSCEQIEQILVNFIPYGIQNFLLSGGEPTLHSEFERVLDLVDRYPQIVFGIVTNGTNPNKKLLEFLNSRKNFRLQISLDGSCEEQNAKTRGTGNFEKTLDFAKKILTPSIPPLLKMVVSQKNFGDVEQFCKLALSLGFTPELAFIYKSGNGTAEWEQKQLSSLQKLQILKLAKRLNKEVNANIFLPVCTSRCPLGEELKDLSLCIKVDGSIQPCQSLYDSKYTVGNALSFNKTAFEQNMAAISALASRRYSADFGCAKCMLNDICGRGCMAEAFNLSGNDMSDDGNCDYRKQQFFHLNLKSVMNFSYE